MKYTLLIYQGPGDFAARTHPDAETAHDWAARCPVGIVEVRPNLRLAGDA